MKRFTLLFLGLTLICLCLNTAYGHVPIKICDFKLHPSTSQGQCNMTTAELKDNGDCTGTVIAYLRVANLSSNPTLGYTYALPNGVPNMYYEYTIDGVSTVIGPINTFQYLYNYKGAGGISYPIYEFSHNMIFDLEGKCKGPAATNINFDVRILDAAGNLYDLDNHGSSQGVFTCLIFEETCNYCDPTCLGKQLDYPDLLACGEPCYGCQPGKLVQHENIKVTEKDSENKYSVINEIIENEIQEISISPNPFSDGIELKLPSAQGLDITVEIMDTRGKSVMIKNVPSNRQNSIYLDLSHLMTGFYYCKVVIGTKLTVKKIVKL